MVPGSSTEVVPYHGPFGPPISAEDKKAKDKASKAKWGSRYEDAKPAKPRKAAKTSTDPAPYGVFGPPISAEEKARKDKVSKAKRDSRYEDKSAKPLVKSKHQKDPAVGVKTKDTVPDHTKKLTTNGPKPVVHTKKKEDKPEPKVEMSIFKYKREKRKGAPKAPYVPPEVSRVRKRPLESGPPPKRTRRVSAHEI